MIKLKEILDELTATDIDTMYGGPSAEQYNINIAFRQYYPEKNMLTFKTWDMMGSHTQYTIKVIMLDLNTIKDKTYKPEDLLKLALTEGNVKVHCSCPSFTYNGFAYLSGVLDGNVMKEPRKPVVRNPNEEGIVCKHIMGLFEKIDRYIPTIARRLAN